MNQIQRTFPDPEVQVDKQGTITMTLSSLTVVYICAYNSLVDFEWDPDKANANFNKHDVLFSDAISVLEDEFALTVRDPFSDEEERWITLGMDMPPDFSSWSMYGEAKQFDSFRRGLQRRANGRNTRVWVQRGTHQNEEKP